MWKKCFVSTKYYSSFPYRDTFTVPGLSPGKPNLGLRSVGVNSPTKRGQRKEEGWKEVIRK